MARVKRVKACMQARHAVELWRSAYVICSVEVPIPEVIEERILFGYYDIGNDTF